MITSLSLSFFLSFFPPDGEEREIQQRQTQAGREHVETERDAWDVIYSLAELFVRSFITESTSHPDALCPDVKREQEAVPKLQDLAEGEKLR